MSAPNATRRRFVASAFLATTTFALGACGTGFDAQTNRQYQSGIGADDRTGDMQVLSTLLVANPDGSATVSASVMNKTGADIVLTGVTVAGPTGTELPVRSTPFLLPLPDGRLARLGVVQRRQAHHPRGAGRGANRQV